jgi:hypothetical protein
MGRKIVQALNGEERSTSVSAEFALDFMFWPTENVGWFVEPTWSINPRNGQQAMAVSAGLTLSHSAACSDLHLLSQDRPWCPN